MSDDHNALLARADQYARDLDEYYEDSVICNNARECLDDLAAELRALTSRHEAAIRALGRSLKGDWPIESAAGGPSHWRYDDAEVTPEERAVLDQAKDPHP